jgi:carbonic anhydrase
VIHQLQQENQSVVTQLQQKDEENRQLAQLVQEMERRTRKA